MQGTQNPMAYYQNLMDFYEDCVGQWIDAWLLENPGSVVAVIEAEDVESDQGKFLWPWISFDYDEDDPATQTGRHFEDDLKLHVFYVDIERPKEQETTYDDGSDDEKWPKEGAGGLYWDPEDLYLHTDGSAFGEHSVWIIPINCDNFTYGSARFRIRDDCENWRRSEDFVSEMLNLYYELIVSTSVEQAPCDSQVVFEAEIENLPSFYDSLLNSINWFVIRNPGAYNEEELNEAEYHVAFCNREFRSVISGSWKGPTFTIDKVRDESFTVRACIDICGFPLKDDKSISSDCMFVVEDLMFMGPTLGWDDPNTFTFVEGRIVSCEDGHVKLRNNGETYANVYALVVGNEAFVPDFLIRDRCKSQKSTCNYSLK